MQKAAKEKTFLFTLIASAWLFCAPAIASSIDVSPLETRAELSAENGQFSVERPSLTPETTPSYYDPFSEVAPGSSVAPRGAAGVADELGTMGTRLQRLGYDQANANRILNAIENGEQVVVVGENMKRVGAVARMVENAGGRSVTYGPRNFRSSPENLSRLDIEANRSWIRYWAKDKGAPVIDIGRQPTIRPDGPSPFYGLENRSLNRWNIYTPFGG